METRKTVVFFLGQSQYESMREMTFCFMDAFYRLGYETISIDLCDSSYNERLINTINNFKIDLFFGLNGWGGDFLINGKSLYDTINVPFFAFYVDHPMYHVERLKWNIDNYIVSFIDKGHIKDIDNFLDSSKKFTKAFVPHATYLKTPKNDIQNRKHEIVFAGSIKNPDDIRKNWLELSNPLRNLMETVVEKSIYSDNRDILSLFSDSLAENDIYLSGDNFKKLLAVFQQVDSFTRNYRRDKVIRSLLKTPITIYGNGWDYISWAGGNKAEFFPALKTKELYSILEDTKIFLNVFPNYPNGSHERVFDAMIHHAVCLTDESHYLKDFFKHEENILYYQYDDQLLGDKLKHYVSNTSFLQQVADQGYHVTQEHHTWNNRAAKILEIVKLHTTIRSLNSL
ncbi:glycosyltransferase [Neobacillus rhizosphaerae]|uniref:glycosyltransferase n=1 Tax=Neobacillus rhizosphaerae TaxID=2880965 RepID=UPI003D2CD5FC